MSNAAEQPAAATSSTPPTPVAPSPDTIATPVDDKVVILFKSTPGAPAMKEKKFKLRSSATMSTVADFLRKQLRFANEDPLFLFLNCAFQPCPDERIADLYKCFQVNGKLVVHYSTTVAWG